MRDSGRSNKWAAAAAAAEKEDDRGTGRGYDDWEDSEWLQTETRRVQSESQSSTRRALQRITEAQGSAEHSLNKLNQQSEQLYSIEQRLERTDAHAKVSDAKVDHLKSLSRFFMIPAFGSGKAKRREAKLADQGASEASRNANEREQEWRQRQMHQEQRLSQTSRSASKNFSTPIGVERDQVEQEIDDNLDQISSGLARLKMMGTAMNGEIASQSSQLNRIRDRTESSKEKVNRLKHRIDNDIRK